MREAEQLYGLSSRRMKRLVIAAGIVLAAAEIAARIVLPAATVRPDEWDAPGRDGWCGGVRYATDGDGQRGGAAARVAQPLAHPLIVVGGEFTAGAGLERAERWPERLAPRAVAGGWSEVVAWSARDRLAAVRRLLELPRAKESGGGPPAGVVRHARGPDAVLLEIDPSFNGGDGARFSIADAAPDPIEPIEPFEDLSFGPSRLLDAARLFSLRRTRDAREAEVAELAAHDGWTARAADHARHRLDRVTEATRTRKCDAEQERLLRASIAELHGMSRALERRAVAHDFIELVARFRDEQRTLIVVVTGATPLTLGLASSAADGGAVVIHSPPFELDPQLRVALPAPRPAAVVHAQVAESAWSALTRRGLVSPAAGAPEAVQQRADELEQHLRSRGGLDESLLRLAEAQVGTIVVFERDLLPLAVLGGIEPGGRLAAGAVGELVIRRPPLAIEMVVRGEAPAGTLPTLRRRCLVGDKIDVADARAKRLEGAATRPGCERVEWSFLPLTPTGPVDLPGLTLELAAPEGAPPAAREIWLRELLHLSAPPDETTGDRNK
jgi:hypothetical protein